MSLQILQLKEEFQELRCLLPNRLHERRTLRRQHVYSWSDSTMPPDSGAGRVSRRMREVVCA